MSIESKVEEWNAYYKAWSGREKLKDLGNREYEEGVAYSLLDIVCSGDVALAIIVLNHPLCAGGWMLGDAGAFLEKLRDGVGVSSTHDEDEDEDE